MIVYFSRHRQQPLLRPAALRPAGRFPSQRRCADPPGAWRRTLQSETPWVFVSPTYAWRIPRLFDQWIRRGSFQGSKDAYFVMTCGGETGDAQKYLADLCAEKGLTYRGLLPIVMPDNYLVMFETPTDAAAREILSAARPQMEEAARRIKSGETVEPLPMKLLDKVKSGIGQRGHVPLFYQDQALPRHGSLHLLRQVPGGLPAQQYLAWSMAVPQWGQTCTHCMALYLLVPPGGHRVRQGAPGAKPVITARPTRDSFIHQKAQPNEGCAFLMGAI